MQIVIRLHLNIDDKISRANSTLWRSCSQRIRLPVTAASGQLKVQLYMKCT